MKKEMIVTQSLYQCSVLNTCDGCAYANNSNCAVSVYKDVLAIIADQKKQIRELKTKLEEKRKHESRKKLPCVCGRKRLNVAFGFAELRGKVFIQCPNCGKEAGGDSEIAAIRAWNASIKEEERATEHEVIKAHKEMVEDYKQGIN